MNMQITVPPQFTLHHLAKLRFIEFLELVDVFSIL